MPSRQQYLDLKAQQPRAILLYRLGDFYETFDEDARVVARDARIALTARSFGRSGRIPMAGIPHHALNHYLGRLLAAGHTVAIAEQMSEPGRGLVERAITRVVTPGTVAEPALLPPTESRYLAACHTVAAGHGLAWVDVSTGEFAVLELAGEDRSIRLREELARLSPAECLVPDTARLEGQLPLVEETSSPPSVGQSPRDQLSSGQPSLKWPSPDQPSPNHLSPSQSSPDQPSLATGRPGVTAGPLPVSDQPAVAGDRSGPTSSAQRARSGWEMSRTTTTRLEHWHFAPERARRVLMEHFNTQTLEAFGCATLPAALGAAGAIVAYLKMTNPAFLPLLTGLRTETAEATVGLDAATRRNLELTRGLRGGGTRGSLLATLDVTRTGMGARALRRLIGQPRRDLPCLKGRQAIVAALVAEPAARSSLAVSLAVVGDLERLIGRTSQTQASPRDFLALGTALAAVPIVGATLRATAQSALIALANDLDPCTATRELIEQAISDDPHQGPSIRSGFSTALDAARTNVEATRAWLAGLERQERERTGIRSLKVGFNKVFGYYIEVTRPNLSLVPEDYLRKQTVANGERYFTTALKEAESRLLAADEAIAALERSAVAELIEAVISRLTQLRTTAAGLALVDAQLALSEVAARAGWTLPDLDESDSLVIEAGRHPVVEAALEGEPFIANDCRLGEASPRLLVVTGPNMGGKSTYLRQVALIVLLAQIGSFVPAAAARIGLVDRIFSRIGAQDDLAGGQSTFMVEMVETATILHQASRRSLIILDEVGRGTSTHDGLAIARAVVEDLHDRVGARTLFATHFLELTALEPTMPGLANAHLAVHESAAGVIFLHAVRPGPASRAYGVHVARLAGLPGWVADRAEQLVREQAGQAAGQGMTARHQRLDDQALIAGPAALAPDQGLAPVALPTAPGELLLHALADLELNELTPRQALDWLFEQQERLRAADRRRP